MSPESFNKHFCEKYSWSKLFDYKINHQSDIFQLGKVIWYILQGNLPTGGIRRRDFLWKNEDLYQLVRTMINSSKSKRTKKIEDVIEVLQRVFDKLSTTQEQYATLY